MDDSFWSRLKGLFSRGGAAGDSNRPKKTYEHVLDAMAEKGLTNSVDNEMIRGVFEFGDSIVREIMMPRTDIAHTDLNDPISEAIKVIIKSGHSRLPVVDGHLDNIKGVFYAMDLLPHWGSESIKVSDIMREPYFIPETKSIAALFEELKRMKTHIAIVIDEYGGTSGLITMEDLIEEVLGDIEDEYDEEPEEPIVEQPDGSVMFDARVPIDEFAEYFGVAEPDESIDTVGGLALFLSGSIPLAGEEFEYCGLKLRVADADKRHVKKILATGGKPAE